MRTVPTSVPASLSFFFNDTATTEIYTLSLHDALPIYLKLVIAVPGCERFENVGISEDQRSEEHTSELQSHSFISYAVFCLKNMRVLKLGLPSVGSVVHPFTQLLPRLS